MSPSPVSQTQQLLDFLLEKKLIFPPKVQELKEESLETGKDLIALLEAKGGVAEEDLWRAKAQVAKMPYMDLFGLTIAPAVLNLMSEDLAATYQMVPIERKENVVKVGMVNPNDFKALGALEFIGQRQQIRWEMVMISPSGFHTASKQYASLKKEVEEAIQGAGEELLMRPPEELAEGNIEDVVKHAPVTKMVSVILRHAVEGKASDVHIEPLTSETRVRYRVDGVLHTSIILPREVHDAIIARIKVMANLKIDETRLPQDGRFRMTINGHEVDYRVSTMPLMNGEKVVMRILDTSQNLLDLEGLGFKGRQLDIIRENIQRPHGMFLVTGPTGSGKSTTLYALMTILNKDGVNIITLEDPVEYFIRGINQSQINPDIGMTFSVGLRSILRQDPDVIMVGEIRDTETAELATHAALTGHIVLSTLHTNNAFGAIPRLVDMQIPPFLIASSLNIVVAQRLVRRICEFCREPFQIPESLEREVWGDLESLKETALPKDVHLTKPLNFFHGKGCARCEEVGYRGRLVIAEVLEVTNEIKKFISSDPGNVENIRAAFSAAGMLSMRQDGIFKALQGLTTIEEVWQVTRED
jgi:type IV pilus assembly protein PilB